MGSLHQAFLAACGSFSLYPPLLQDSARSTWIKSTANILHSCFKTVSLSSQQKRWGKKEFSTLRRLTLLIFSVTVAAMRNKPASLCGEFFVSGSEEKIAVEKATCNQKQEPRLDRKQEQCAPVGDDGRTDKLESLQRVSIGWQIEGTFIEQIGICIDGSNFGTIWTNHTVRGASIALRDIDPKRPSFRADTGAYTRKNQRFFKWSTSTKLNKLYSKNSQKSTVTALLGGITSIEDETIIETSSSGTDYFAKGHLSPDAAFVYNVLQDATYYFINVAPQ